MTEPAGELRLVGRLREASNATFLAVDDAESRWVYKPVAGEAPLWDFPSETLSRREVAAYEISEALGFGVVPPTRWVEGPLGPGSAQVWVDGEPTPLVDLVSPTDADESWLLIAAFQTQDDEPILLAHRDDLALRRIALFDALINNADRKGAHLIAGEPGLRGVDHGLTMHVEAKLRTVLWGWAGDELTEAELAIVSQAATLAVPLAPGLSDGEWEALTSRAGALFAAGEMPRPGQGRPAIPWPPL